MAEDNISQIFRMKKIKETRNCFIRERELNELMSKKHKGAYTTLNSIEHIFALASAVSRWIQFLLSLLCLVYLYEFCNMTQKVSNSCRN